MRAFAVRAVGVLSSRQVPAHWPAAKNRLSREELSHAAAEAGENCGVLDGVSCVQDFRFGVGAQDVQAFSHGVENPDAIDTDAEILAGLFEQYRPALILADDFDC